MNRILFFCLALLLVAPSCTKAQGRLARIQPGAEQLDQYLPMLAGKRVALVMNQTALVNNTLLVDTLLSRGVRIQKIFVPEHGLRGRADAGATIKSGVDEQTGLPVISLYGNNKKPTKAQLADVDVLVYDLQDVGVRFYTYISTLQYCMEACAQENVQLMVLDRPNPLGSVVDGPVLDTGHRSFVGMQPIPIAYGMTPGEYAKMLQGEHWFTGAKKLRLEVIQLKFYDHSRTYILPVAPSPNLRTPQSILFYPSLCLFEGTVVSVGRGTGKPFEQWGHPDFAEKTKECFRPQSMVGATKPLFEGKNCYGRILDDSDAALVQNRISLKWLVEAYQWYGRKPAFFNNFFDKLAGGPTLRNQILQGWTEDRIRQSWQPGLQAFLRIRAKYLLYPEGR